MAKSKSKSRAKVMLLSCMTIMMCVATITAGTFALFSDSVTIHNHLQAGTLDASLYRTQIEYRLPDANGILPAQATTISDVTTSTPEGLQLDGTNTAQLNSFGINDKLQNIVPESYFKASLKIKNNGNVAFKYVVKIEVVEGENTELAKQLKVIVNEGETTEASKYANEGAIDLNEDAIVYANGSANFTVKVVFENITGSAETETNNNNLAQGQGVKFDLVISAVQYIAQ
jgi:predicted ribosomally synthesized peptide with SipW-like signal peptide